MDHPTRRFDQPGDEATSLSPTRRLTTLSPDDLNRACLRCSTPMIPALIGAEPTSFLLDHPLLVGVRKGTNFFGAPNYAISRCRVLVCPTCGYTELLTLEPELLQESESGHSTR